MKPLLSVLAVAILLSIGCNSDSTSTTGLRLNSAGDFTASASALNLFKETTTGQCANLESPITQDDPILEDGLDCDLDSGDVVHITPSKYAIAFKRVSLVPQTGSTQIDLVADTGTLARSEVVDFTSSETSETVVTINPSDLSAGTFTGIEAEIYYFQLTFPVGGTTRNVRIYMSDDSFTAEGNLGHHQGDITFINDSGTELGWIDSTWSDTLATTRGTDQNGAGGTDAETGHDRGFFGNADFWNASNLDQGADQDIYLFSLNFDTPLEIPDPDTISNLTTITVTFSVADTFFFEDFAPKEGVFSPDSGGEATSEGAAWAPLTPTAELSVTTE